MTWRVLVKSKQIIYITHLIITWWNKWVYKIGKSANMYAMIFHFLYKKNVCNISFENLTRTVAGISFVCMFLPCHIQVSE